jgi:hypothetical protein
VDKGVLIQRIATKGTNPFFQTEQEISNEIATTLLPQLPSDTLDSIYFYGAGCAFDKIAVVKRAIGSHLHVTHEFEVSTDMLGAARSLCGHQPGIACILGTGSNSCLYDGCNIVDNVSPLGFILGDEGSGAVLGKRLVGDLLKNQLSAKLKDKFLTQFNLTVPEIIDRVYRKPFPNRFLAGLSSFLEENISEPGIRELLVSSFHDFLKRNVMQYKGYADYPIHFIGSIAYFYKHELVMAGNELNIRIGKVVKSPMDGLIEYHSENS